MSVWATIRWMATGEISPPPDFSLRYDGPAVASGTMPVRDLAPALFALGELFQTAHQTIDPLSSPISLEVRAFESGSFDVNLHLAVAEWIAFLSRPDVMALGNLIGIVTDSAQGLFALAKFLATGTITALRDTDEGTRIEDNHGNVFIAKQQVFNVYQAPGVPALLHDVVAPLNQEGINVMVIERQDAEALEVRQEDLSSFDPELPPLEVLNETESTLYLTLVSPVFGKPTNKWRFSTDGIPVIWAAIEDPRFLRLVEDRRDLFGSGDMMLCRVRIRQVRRYPWERPDTEWTILEVLDHQQGVNMKPRLPLGDDPS